jgi:hypothetical protein
MAAKDRADSATKNRNSETTTANTTNTSNADQKKHMPCKNSLPT